MHVETRAIVVTKNAGLDEDSGTHPTGTQPSASFDIQMMTKRH
jgi:hypothetical protein